MTKKVVDEKAAATPSSKKGGFVMPGYAGKALKAVVVMVVLAVAFWWFSLIPRSQEMYPTQVRAACHTQANKFVEDELAKLTAEQQATYNQLSAYEIQYTLCRRANGVSD